VIGISRITAFGRPLVLDRITNRVVAILTLVILAAAFIHQLTLAAPFTGALVTAAATAFAVFLCWAIGREIDPAYQWSAFVALPFTLIFTFIFGAPGIVALFFILLFSRVLNGSTGIQATSIDSIMLIILGVILFYDGIIFALLILGMVFFFDAFFDPANRKQKIFAFLSLALFVAMFLFFPGIKLSLQIANIHTVAVMLLLVVAVIILVMLTGYEQVPDDKNRSMLRKQRVCLARLMIAVFILLEMAFKGDQAFVLLYPAALAFCGAALYHLGRRFKKARSPAGDVG